MVYFSLSQKEDKGWVLSPIPIHLRERKKEVRKDFLEKENWVILAYFTTEASTNSKN
jgi:hypothetical protein